MNSALPSAPDLAFPTGEKPPDVGAMTPDERRRGDRRGDRCQRRHPKQEREAEPYREQCDAKLPRQCKRDTGGGRHTLAAGKSVEYRIQMTEEYGERGASGGE